LVFVLLLLSYVLSAFSGSQVVGSQVVRLIALGLYMVTLLIAMRPSGSSRRRARALRGVMVVATLLVALLGRLFPGDAASGLVALWAAALTLATLCVVVLRILHHEVVSFQTVFGALSAYLLIGFTFTALYTMTASWSSGPFFVGGEASSSANLQYFSFVTLTTTGYGDLTAATVSGRTLAVMEALLGQIFLVTLVARLVSVFGTTRSVPARSEHPARSEYPARSEHPVARDRDGAPTGHEES
jgi:hypothetical protein